MSLQQYFRRGTAGIMAKNRTVEARSPEYELLGKRITEARVALDISQVEAARRIGISQSTYSGYETGTRRVKLSMLRQIASVYNVAVDWLIGTELQESAERPTLTLSDSEYNLIVKFRELSDAEQAIILRSVGINQ